MTLDLPSIDFLSSEVKKHLRIEIKHITASSSAHNGQTGSGASRLDSRDDLQTDYHEPSTPSDQDMNTSKVILPTDSGYISSDETALSSQLAPKGPAESDDTAKIKDDKAEKIFVLPEVILFGHSIRSDCDVTAHVSRFISDKLDELRALPKLKRLDAIKRSIHIIKEVIAPFEDIFILRKDASVLALA